VYERIVELPLLLGAVKEISAVVAPVRVAITEGGAPGRAVIVKSSDNTEDNANDETSARVVNKSLCVPPVPVITRSVKVAIPATARTVVVPLSVPVPEYTDALTLNVELAITLLLASRISTIGCVPKVEPLVEPIG
jgi:hypothetical protein